MPSKEMILAGVFLSFAVGIWLVFLRPVPVETATGTVRSKTFKPAGEYVQYQPGSRSSFRSATRIPIAECYVLGIEVTGEQDELRYAVNTTAATRFEVGQRVNIQYQRRGVPPFWRRVYVTDVTPAE
jgi:hypothetical protein